MDQQQRVLDLLDAMGIKYDILRHRAAFTVKDMDELELDRYGYGVKNLFVRDSSGKRLFLIALGKDKRADLKGIQKQLGCSRLSFASEESLFENLAITKGSVSPLAIINDASRAVEMVMDQDLKGKERLGLHPNDNTATLWISFDALQRIIENSGHDIKFINV
ncbi:MAG: prolyl-tRNA synthetase associated domain-containing protein [Deltaproteobacteria bacterium]